jgi:hypothetical protein
MGALQPRQSIKSDTEFLMTFQIQKRPRIYFDKGALSLLSPLGENREYDICYSEALLLDLKSDETQSKFDELDLLNSSGAFYLFRDETVVDAKRTDAREEFANTSTFEVEAMSGIYRFLNGGGESSFSGVMNDQFAVFREKLNETIGSSAVSELQSQFEMATAELPVGQTAADWHREVQSATKDWGQDQTIGLAQVFESHPELADLRSEFFPSKLPNFDQIQIAAMLLGSLHLGQDKGINSPLEQKSTKAAWNGYIDCLHVTYGMSCDVFLSTDKATIRRYKLLSDYWGLDRAIGTVEKGAPKGA